MTVAGPWPACWKPDQAGLIVTDVAAQDDNILLAVHQEPQLRSLRVPLRGQRPPAGSGEPKTQRDLFDHFVGPAPAEGTLIVPLIGAPGTGKSHLIRWLKAALPTDDRYEIRHIPREGTSLPSVIERIFAGVDGPEFDELRAELAKFRGQLDLLDPGERLERVATRLMLRMAELLQFAQVPWHRSKDIPEELRTALCHSTVLPALLTDAVVRAKLTREGGAVYRIARDIVQGYVKDEDEDEDELGFRETDLSSLAGLRGTSPYAARALVTLRLPGNTAAAVRILSDALDQASAEVVPTGSLSLSELLRRFRLLLAQQDRELVLLFEDIAIARGLQQDLIDALTTPGRRPGEEPLCTLRVALAVTSDYWEEQAPETLSTRAHAWQAQMYDMDVPADEATDRAPDLVGRYLNAARIGKETLLGRRAEELADHVENYCDGCPLRPECHPAFGTTSDGFGLFPLTKSAIRRLSSLADRRSRPRLVLSEVVAPTLAQFEAVNDHRFPANPAWDESVATAVETGDLTEMSAAQQDALERAGLTGEQRTRARTVLRAWTAGEAAPTAILGALGVDIETPQHGEGAPSGGVEDEPVPAPKPPDTSSRPARDDDGRRIEDWGGGAVALGPQLARRLRAAIWTEVTDGVRWAELGLNMNGVLDALGFRGPRQQRPNQAISIVNTAAGGVMGTASTVEPLLVFEPSVRSAQILAAVHRLDKGTAVLEDVARVRGIVAQAEASVQERIDRLAGQATDLAKMVTLAFSPLAAAAGAVERPTWTSSLRTMESGQECVERGPAWTALHRAALREHEWAVGALATLATRSQGGAGAATALDPTLVDERALSRDPAGLDRSPRAEAVAERHAALVDTATAAAEEEAGRIKQLLLSIGEHTGDANRIALKSIDDAVSAATSAAEEADLLTPHDAAIELAAVRLPRASQAAAALESGWVAVRAAERGLSVDSLFRLGAVDTRLLAVLQRYLDLAAEVLAKSGDAAAEAIRQRGSSESSDLGDEVRAAASVLLAMCEVPT